MLPEPETAILMDDAAADSESDDPPVLDLFCSMCSTCVCRRGVRVLLVASPQDSLYSTDIPGDNLRLGEVDGAIDTCECKIRQVSCARCDGQIGYHVTKPCSLCNSMSNNGHYWLFYNEGVTSRQRVQVVATAGPTTEAETTAGTMTGARAGRAASTEAVAERSAAVGNQADTEETPVATPVRWSQLSYNGFEEAPHKGESTNTSTLQEQRICAICMCPMWQPTRLDAPCGHVFCFGCISREVDERGRCPLDRHAISRRSLIRMDKGAAWSA